MPTSPNTDNYFVGKAMVAVKEAGDTTFRALGNCPEVEFTPSTDTLDHFSSMEGVKSKDKSIVLSKGGELRILMEELTARNLSLLVLGDVDETNPASPVIEIFGSNSKTAEVMVYGTNEVGPRMNMHFLKVEFLPSGSFQPISDEWGQLEITGQVETSGGSFGTITFLPTGAHLPQNVGAPVIANEDSVAVNVGDDITITSNGSWTDVPTSYTYTWYKDNVVIAAETAATYTTVVGDIGAVITAKVIAINATGSSTMAVSNGVGPVVA